MYNEFHIFVVVHFTHLNYFLCSENEPTGPTDPGGGNSIAIGGPLMTSVVNGTRTKPPANRNETSSNNNILNPNTTSFSSSLNFENEFNFDFPSSTWELEPTSWGDTRPDSRQSVTPVSTPTPRPPSAPAYSPVATNVAQSPLTPFVAQPSPTVPNPSTPVNPYSGTFPFSPMAEPNFIVEEQKDTKVNVMEDSGRLRNLLTKPQNSADSANDAENRNKNRILKGLLNQQDEDEHRNDNRNSPRALANARGSMPGPSELPKTSSSGGNNMLLQVCVRISVAPRQNRF